MRLKFHLTLLAAFGAVMLAGCDANQLYMAAHTVVGINAQVNPEQSSGWVLVGYDRSFAALIPRSVQRNDDPQAKDAMSALACSSLWVKGIAIKRYTESIATGQAAQIFAGHLKDETKAGGSDPKGKSVKDFFSCYKDKPADGAQ